MPIVYQHRRNDTNEIFYIGIGKHDKRAFQNHKKCRNPHWHYIVNKVGHTVEITHKDVIWEEACSIEIYLISFYGRADLGLGSLVNMTDGGEGSIGAIFSEETKAKLSEAGKGRIFSEESKDKMRKPRSEEAKANMSKGQIGKKLSKEHKTKLSAAAIGKKQSEERIKKVSEALIGIKHSEERNAKKKKPQEIVECPHCSKEGGNRGMKRYHFDNCKLKDEATK
jgi:hypothetical protein